MDFTREPIVQTVITARDGCKLAIRNSKGAAHEEYFLDAVEVVSFGSVFFFRSLERPKNFLVPVTDYEVLEVRETRMILKSAGTGRAAKGTAQPKEQGEAAAGKTEKAEPRLEKKRERRKSSRRRRIQEERVEEQTEKHNEVKVKDQDQEKEKGAPPNAVEVVVEAKQEKADPQKMPNLAISPPGQLISENISHYRREYGSAFFGDAEVEQLQADYVPSEELVEQEAAPASTSDVDADIDLPKE